MVSLSWLDYRFNFATDYFRNSMITFKINGTPYEIPTAWEDVKFWQYLGLLNCASLTDHIALFTGIPRETLEQAELRNLEKISLALSFLSFAPTFERTERVGPYTMPTDVTIQSTGQFENLRALLTKIPKDNDPEIMADLYLSACAIYCQKLRDGKFDNTKIDEVKAELKNYSCAEVIGTGAFFLFRPLNLSKNTTIPSRRFSRRLRSMIQDLPGYRKSLAFLERYFGSAVK